MKKCGSTRKMADGGKVLSSETIYGRPTYGRAVLARVGVGDGYGNPKPKKAKPKMSISNAKEGMTELVSNRKKMLDET